MGFSKNFFWEFFGFKKGDMAFFIHGFIFMYKRIKIMKNIIKKLLRESLLAEENYTNNIREFLDQDPKSMTVGTAYYTASMNSYMNKTYIDENGIKQPNPMYDKLFKNTRFIFRWKDTYAKAVGRVNFGPVDIGARSGTYEKIDGYEMLESGKSGEYLPIIPTGSEASYSIYDNGQWSHIDKDAIKQYLKPPSPSFGASGVSFRPLIVNRIYKLTGGGNTWINPNFEFKYLGVGN